MKRSSYAFPEQHSPLVSVSFETQLGWIGFLGSPQGMTFLTFGHSDQGDALERLNFASHWEQAACGEEKRCADEMTVERADSTDFPLYDWMTAARELLIAYASGEPVDLTTIPIDLPVGTRFEQSVRDQLAKIGYGCTVTYGELAEQAGSPRAARAVGSVMSKNPIPLVIACHRVVGASGKLGGYSAPSGSSMKQRLLNMEQNVSYV